MSPFLEIQYFQQSWLGYMKRYVMIHQITAKCKKKKSTHNATIITYTRSRVYGIVYNKNQIKFADIWKG